MQLIPAIDLIDGRCVRLFKGDYSVVTHYPISPVELLSIYRAHGAGWIHIVDLDGARDGVRANQAMIGGLAQSRVPSLQVGGGIRDVDAIEAMLQLGVARVVIGSAAITDQDAAAKWLEAFGGERIALALDVRCAEGAAPRIATHGWQHQSGVSLWDAVDAFLPAGLVHVLCTDVGRDGALSGPNFALYAEALRRYPQVRWQASGGIRSGADLCALAKTGVSAAISGKALLERRIAAQEIATFSPNA